MTRATKPDAAAAHTPLPWTLCHDGDCSCLTISCADHPILKVKSGSWGDTYPSIRATSGSLEGKFEAYIEQITYGEIDPEVAKANAKLVVAAVNAYPQVEVMRKALDTARFQLVTLGGDPRSSINDDGSINGDEIQAEVLDLVEAALSAVAREG